MFKFRHLNLLLLVALCANFVFCLPAFSLSGLALQPGSVVQVNKVKCGFVGTAWVPGTLLKSGNFLPATDSIASVKTQLKNKKLSQAKKNALKAKLAKLKSALKKNAKVCKSLPTSQPTPVETPASPLPGAVTVAWNTTAMPNAANIGADYLYFCPANPSQGLSAIYGHDIYTADSPICVAAVHLGLFKRGLGGNVKFRIKGAQTFYFSSVRNGIESQFFGPFANSYVFINLSNGSEIITGTIPEITWYRDAGYLYNYLGQEFAFSCPGNSNQTDSIWGTDLYTYDSSICTAAVHAGRITLASGGVVTIRIEPGAASYVGSTRHGITSGNYGSWGGSFKFVP